MDVIDSRASRVLITVLIFALALGFLYTARHTLVAFLFAIFFAYLVDPLVSKLEHLVKGRGRAIAIIYVLLLGVLVVFFTFVGPQIGRQGAKLSQALPQLLDRVTSGEIALSLGTEHGLSKATAEQLKRFLASHSADIKDLAQRAGLRAAEAAKNVWLLVLIPILAAFFLKGGREFSGTFLTFVHSKPQREFMEGVLADMNEMLAHFIRAQLTLAGLSLIAYIAVLSLMRVPYALVLGTAGGVMAF